MSTSPGVKPGGCFQFVLFEYRRQKAKAAEFISGDRYHHPTKVLETLGHKNFLSESLWIAIGMGIK